MRKCIKRFLSVALTASMIVGLAACGGNAKTTGNPTSAPGQESSNQGDTNQNTEEKVTSITIMVDSTVFTEANGRAYFEEALEKLMGVDIIFIQPDHSGYYETVGQTFANPDLSTWPDVVLLGSNYYASYAAGGVLADITSIWEESDLRKSGRIANEQVVNDLKVDGKLYGIAPATGNGCITYVKKAWLDRAGITKLPTNYEEYTAMLTAFSELSTDGYALTSPGLINNEAPYVNYLPEFFQGAYPDFYQKENGEWIDGFTEDKMIDAMDRLITAYDEGWIDPEYATNKTSTCRDKFYADKCGVFTYWAGTWAYNLASNLEAKGVDSELIPLEPIAEVGAYIERNAPVWAITSACKAPKQVFDLFFGTVLDGADGQILWTYGVEGVHWGTEAETITVGEGDSAQTYTFKDGEFHFKANLETNGNLYSKHHIDNMLSIASFIEGNNIGGESTDPRAREAQDIFNAHRVLAPKIVSNDTVNQYQAEIMSLRIQLTSMVVSGELSIDDAMARYKDEVGDKVQAVLDSLNKAQ
ncbi:MAG: extracellular solute-binding protein [Lachnospiraceae bacterium]